MIRIKTSFIITGGPSSRENEEIIYDRQIEDNTTKSLINCWESWEQSS